MTMEENGTIFVRPLLCKLLIINYISKSNKHIIAIHAELYMQFGICSKDKPTHN